MATGSRGRATVPIRRRNLGSDVYSVLWDRILSRELHAGEKLSDLHLSEELGVSRTPVREALHRLVQDGVVTYSPNRGFAIASFSRRDVEEIFDLRSALESLALRTAASDIPPEEVEAAIEELNEIQRMVKAAKTPEERNEVSNSFLHVDMGFHHWLINRSGNQRLIGILNGLWAQISVFQRAGTHIPGWNETAMTQHREILDLLKDGNIDAAADALEHHILDVKDRVIIDIAPSLTEDEE